MALDAKQLADLLKLRAIGWSQKDIAEAIGISQQVVAYQLKKLKEASLKKGDEVRLVGFGTFSVAKRAATTGRNPRTGEKINIPASKQPKFKAGKELKEAVN